MDAKTISELVSNKKHGKNGKTLHEIQESYARGYHLAIYQPSPKESPDNRISVPFIKRAIAMILGYMTPVGSVTYSGKFYDSTLKPIYGFNDEETLLPMLLEDGLVHGKCFELHWFGEDKNLYFYPIPISECYPIYSKTLKKQLIGFVWCRPVEGGTMATYYDTENYQEYFKAEKKEEFSLINEGSHGFGVVPVNEGKISRNGANLFDHVISLVDFYDKAFSEDIANEAERLAQSYLLMANQINSTDKDESGLTDYDKIKRTKTISNLSEDGGSVGDKVQFLTKNLNTSFLEVSLKTGERLIYEMLMIVNPNDDNFASASGIAQAYKLLGMEYLCAAIEAHLSMFLQNRIKIIASFKNGMKEDVSEASNVTINFKRNLPNNLMELSQIAAQLSGTLSDETILGIFPSTVIPDKVAELARIRECKNVETMQGVIDGRV